MALNTFSAFYYDFEIRGVGDINRFINFDEGGGELSAAINIGAWTATELMTQVAQAMNAVGGQTYTVSIDRDTRFVTISAPGTFDLLVASGSQTGTSAFQLLGFTTLVDRTGQTSYTGDAAAGDAFFPQFVLQDFVGPENNQEKIDASVNEAASGELEVVTFGVRKFLDASFKYITNKTGDGKVIRNNPTGVADAQRFFQYMTFKKPAEIMLDIDNRAQFFKIILERTPTGSDGTAYLLTELVTQNLPDYFEINNVRFRIVEG